MTLLIATNINEVGISLLDFFSIAHICMGIGMFLFFSFIYYYFFKKTDFKSSLYCSCLLSLAGAIGWELIENILFLNWGLKFGNVADSIFNLVSDLFFVGTGAFFMMVLRFKFDTYKKKISDYYLIGSLIFLFYISLYFLFRHLTLY